MFSTTTEHSNITTVSTISVAIIGGVVAISFISAVIVIVMALITKKRQRGISSINE